MLWTLPQEKSEQKIESEKKTDWREAFRQQTGDILLDEPTRGATEDEGAELRDRLRQHVPHGAALVVTHDLGFARDVADYVLMICAGRAVAHCDAETLRDFV